MKGKNVFDTLTAVYPTLTKSSKKVADFVFNNKIETQYLSITVLAEECQVAEATISRFCKTLGYDGYNEFKLAVAKSGTAQIEENSTSIYEKVVPEDSILAMSKKLYAFDTAAINQTLAQLDESAVARAVQYLHSAHHVYCFGQGGSGIIAKEAWGRFITVASQFECIEDSHFQSMAAALCTVNDVILFFTYSGATKEMLDVLRPAKERGAKIILITRFSKSPAAAFADIILLCGSREGPLQSGSVAAKMGQMFLIDILYNEFCRRNEHFTEANRAVTSEALASKLL